VETRFFFRFPCQGEKKKTLSPHRQKFELRRSVRFRSPVVFPELSQSCGGAFWGRSCGRPGFRFPCQGEKKNAKSPPAELDFGGHDDFGVTVALRRSSGRGISKNEEFADRPLSSMGGCRRYNYRRGVSKGINLLLWPRRGRGGTETMERRARKGHGRV
jgi:hypothetical protein